MLNEKKTLSATVKLFLCFFNIFNIQIGILDSKLVGAINVPTQAFI